MPEPLVIEVRRGVHLESRHEVDAVVMGADLRPLDVWGDPSRGVLPRSALKPVQALPLIESGAADAHDLSTAQLALACGSHGGEPDHVAVVDAWLERLGLAVDALECGAHPPTHRPSADALVAAGQPHDARHNNCSGKHCGFLCVCRQLGLPTAGYIDPHHPLQRHHVTPAVEELCGLSLSRQHPGIDGCGIPVWSIPLDRLATGWAGLRDRPAALPLVAAMIAEPTMVAGTDRICTRLMIEGAGRVAVKTGAEGVFCAVTDEGVAVALKARDGATRAGEAAIAWLLDRLGVVGPQPPLVLRNWAGIEIGEVRVVR